MKAAFVALLAPAFFCASDSSLASQSEMHLSCDIVVRQYGPHVSNEPTSTRIDVKIDGSGKSLGINTTGGSSLTGTIFRTAPLGRVVHEITNMSTDEMWDVVVRVYHSDTNRLFAVNSLVINRFTGSIRIQSKDKDTSDIRAMSEGTCKRHPEKLF